MNVNDKPATLWLQDSFLKKYTKFSFHAIMTETLLYRFCNIAKNERLRSMMQYTTHYNNTLPPQSDVKLPTGMIQRNMHEPLYNFKRCLSGVRSSLDF
jgi:hypothetical protein